MVKVKKQYTVWCENQISKFLPYHAADSLQMAQSIAASLQRIQHAWRITNRDGIIVEESTPCEPKSCSSSSKNAT